MADSPLLVKSKAFALDIIRVCNEIKQSKRESVLTNQLIRSGTYSRSLLCPRKGGLYCQVADCTERMFRKRILAGIID